MAGAPFLFGKLPAHGDFVARGLADGPRQAWDDWATTALERLGAAHSDYEAAHDAAPPWRFIAGPSPLGPGWRAGALAPSIDSAGRRFILVVGVDGLPPSHAGGQGQDLARAMEDALYRALAEGQTADEVMRLLAEELQAFADLTRVAETLSAAPTGAGVWWSPAAGLGPRAGALPAADLLIEPPLERSENAA